MLPANHRQYYLVIRRMLSDADKVEKVNGILWAVVALYGFKEESCHVASIGVFAVAQTKLRIKFPSLRHARRARTLGDVSP